MICRKIKLNPPPVSYDDKWADNSQTVPMTCRNAAYTVAMKPKGRDRKELAHEGISWAY
jgi:hypothetical protein